MIGLDTNVLARYYIQDEGDAETNAQRITSKKLIESGKPLMVGKTVLLELEWVMRGFYGFNVTQITQVFDHLLNLPQVIIEDKPLVEKAIAQLTAGFDFADALHHASYIACDSMATFDDKKFARRAKRLALIPRVYIPT